MRAKSLSGMWITTVVSLIGVSVCLLCGSGATAEEPSCGVMETDPANWPDPTQFPPLPAYCFGPGGPGPNVCTDNGCILDVLVVYTAAASDDAIAHNYTIQFIIEQAVLRMNEAFVNSQIPTFVRLVDTAEVEGEYWANVPGGNRPASPGMPQGPLASTLPAAGTRPPRRTEGRLRQPVRNALRGGRRCRVFPRQF